jgi:EAL and modified HD-GYP domain-containing signal transduction protein
MEDILTQVAIRRYPILNQDKTLVAHSWYFDPMGENHGRFIDFWQSDLLQSHLRQGKALVRLPSAWLQDDVWLTQTDWSSLILELTPEDARHADVLRVAKLVRQAKGDIALSGFITGDAASHKMSQIAQYIKIDTHALSSQDLSALSSLPVTLIATRVDSEARFEQDRKQGCCWFEGYGFTRPLVDPSGDMINRAALLQALAELNNPQAALDRLAFVIGQDVALTHQLMLMLNSAAMALPMPVHGLTEAVRFLGTQRLAFWASVLMLSNLEDSPPSLLYTALSRAKFMEYVADAVGIKKDKDAWFLVGLFSTLDAFLKCDMAQAVVSLPLAEDIQQALLYQKGEMGHALAAIFMLEGDAASIELRFAHLDVCALSMMYVEASSWAYEIWSSQMQFS